MAAAPGLSPVLRAGGLRVESVVLVDQTRDLGAWRVARYLGTLTPQEYAPILAAVRLIFGA